MNTRNMLGAFHDTEELSAQNEEEEEFDALMRSNETMKVSLTPSRLKTFEVSWNESVCRTDWSDDARERIGITHATRICSPSPSDAESGAASSGASPAGTAKRPRTATNTSHSQQISFGIERKTYCTRRYDDQRGEPG